MSDITAEVIPDSWEVCNTVKKFEEGHCVEVCCCKKV
jgi:hypothetical protein